MRETCARVLAAALMTGAVAFVVAMPALFGPEPDATRPLTAPPSSLRRSVHETAQQAPARQAIEQPPGAQTIANRSSPRARRPQVRRVAADRTPIGRLRPASEGRTKSHPAPAPKPVPSPARETETRQLAATTPPATAPQPATDNNHGHGHHKDKTRRQAKQKSDRGQRSEDESCPGAAPAAEPATPPAAPLDGDDDGRGNGKAKGHDKQGDD
jgi:hypothetical protein